MRFSNQEAHCVNGSLLLDNMTFKTKSSKAVVNQHVSIATSLFLIKMIGRMAGTSLSALSEPFNPYV